MAAVSSLRAEPGGIDDPVVRRGAAFYFRWCQATGREWPEAARDMGLFMVWLRYTPSRLDDEPGPVVCGPGMRPARGERRVNGVLAAVRGLLSYAVSVDAAPRSVLGQIYELADSRDLPEEAKGEDTGLYYRLRAQHRLQELLGTLRELWPNTLILNRAGTDIATRAKDIENGLADVITVGSMALANPDLVERIRAGAPLNTPDPATFYGGGAAGYTDYPTLTLTA